MNLVTEIKIIPLKLLTCFLLLLGVFICLPAVALQPSQYSIKPDVAYGANPAQRMDIYLPEHPYKAPILFVVHGGAWVYGDKINDAGIKNKVSKWIPQGYIVISTDYRLWPDADPLAQANDIAKALAFAQTNATSWGGDPSKFILMGHSAGAHLVSLLASNSQLAFSQGAQPWLGTISLDSPALDVSQLSAIHNDKIFKKDPTFWKKVSPTSQLSKAPNPMLMVCASKQVFSCLQAQQFAAKANALGGQVTLLPVNLSHEEINEQLGLPGDYTAAVESFLHALGLP
jgi:acetyl esterase/lipase